MSQSLQICFGTMTGNAETLANEAHKRAESAGHTASLLNLADVKPAQLTAMKTALFIVSTWGDGEPPDDAAEFWYKLESAELDLTGLNYAVLGLGDKDYADFNGFARQLDERLTKLGATQLTIRADADLDFEDTFVEWSERVLTVLATRQVAATAS